MKIDREYLLDIDRNENLRPNREERGVLALLAGIEEFTACCADKYADPGCFEEVRDLVGGARWLLTYAPDTLRRGALDSAYADVLRAWKINPDTEQWEGS